MKLPTRQEAVQYFYNQVLAQFTAFCIGIYSTGIVSRFFETRSITNLWGFLARKTVIDEGTFAILERIVAVVVGFIVFEIVNRNLKPLLEKLKPVVVQEFTQLARERGWDFRWAPLKEDWKAKGGAILSSLNVAVRNAVRKRISTRQPDKGDRNGLRH